MNTNITEEELSLRKQARRRLVGAIVLVLVAVIFLPMIFDEPKPDTETHEIDIHLVPKEDITAVSPLVLPSESFPRNNTLEHLDQMEFTVDTPPDFSDVLLPMDQPESFIDTIQQDEKKRIPIPGIKPRVNITRSAPVVNQSSNDATQIPPDRSVTHQQTGAYVVQLGAFSDQSKAQQQLNTLMSNGFNAYTEQLVVNGNLMTRVRIGPFANRGAAQVELDKLQRLGITGVVTPK